MVNGGYILDIDIDFWAPEMGIAEWDRTIQKTRQLIAGASVVTIATSPCFIEQDRAVEIVKLLLSYMIYICFLSFIPCCLYDSYIGFWFGCL